MPFFGVPIRNGLPIGLGSVAGFGVQQFDPSQLFEGGTVAGAWYDPSDLSTMFDTSAGTTPVAMPGQGSAVSVGLMLDKSQGLVLGSETVTPEANRDFSSDTGYWTKETGVTISGGAANWSATANSDLYRLNVLTVGKWYRITWTISSYTSGNFRLSVGGTTGVFRTAAGTYTETYYAASNGTLAITGQSSATGSVDNISVRELPGNHAIAFNNTTARPELRARVNLLTYSEQFDNGAWTKGNVTVTANAAVAPDGTTTADLMYPNTSGTLRWVYQLLTASSAIYTRSVYAKAQNKSIVYIDPLGNGTSFAYFNLATGAVGTVSAGYTATITAVGNGWYRCAITNTSAQALSFAGVYGVADADGSTSVTANGTDGIYIWGADLRPANIGANVPAYQRIADALTYDTNGFPLYLLFEGAVGQRGMYTPANLNLSGTDKVAVFAGVRKLAVTTGFPVEFSAAAESNNGAFRVGVDSGGIEYFSSSRGTVSQQVNVDNAAYLPPVTNVVQSSFDIAAPSVSVRLNGVAVGTNTSSQGTGNFGTYPLFIGSRANSAFFLNGHLHSLIIAGSAVSAGNISATEQWVAGKTGIQI